MNTTNSFQSLSTSKRRILVSLLELEEATAYTLAKHTRMSYSTMHASVRMLEETSLVRKIIDTVSRKDRRRTIVYTLTEKGRGFAKMIQWTQIQGEIDNLRKRLSHVGSSQPIKDRITVLEKELRTLHVGSISSIPHEDKKKDAVLKKYEDAEKKLFVIMPSAPILADVWKGAIERACSSEGYVCLKADQIGLSSWITKDIEQCIEMADYVIADITGNNPNVMFELGWALAKSKKHIIIRQQDDSDRVPFDVKDTKYITYANTWSGIERLYNEISKFLKSAHPESENRTKVEHGNEQS